ncbi:MAG: VWA domain-containing protein, partial [Chloroflexota bacterium]|nr:VWA domain-containing protein [Chloroflexota bacterium]
MTPSAQEAEAPDPRSLFQPSLSSRHARLDRIRKALFAGGMEIGDKATGSWKLEDGEQRRSLTLDFETLLQIDELDRALGMLGTVGSVMALSDAAIERLSDDLPQGLASWVEDWAEAASDLRRQRGASGTMRSSLPPVVISAIGRDLLRRLYRPAIARVPGEHEAPVAGTAGDSDETSRSWQPGRPLDLNLVATLSNAIRREGPAGKGRIRLRPDDFEVVERTARTAMSTVLAIDRSRSMGQSGAWTSAKKLTLSMHELIRQSYHRDALSVLAFSSTAEAVAIGELPELHWDRFEHGTHLQAALALGRRMLWRSSAASKQIVVITDGEPTIATTGSGETFASPPTAEVLEATMREVIRCTRERIVINMVILGGETGAATFAEQMARVNGGRIFDTSNQDLGTFILRDYLSR